MFIIESSDENIRAYAKMCKEVDNAERLRLICDCVAMKGIYQFAPLLDLPCVKALEKSTNQTEVQTFYTLKLFTYGTLTSYHLCPEKYLELTPTMSEKLLQLTILTLAHNNSVIPYDLLKRNLYVNSEVTAVNHLLAAIEEGVLCATINSKTRTITVRAAYGRDNATSGPIIRKRNDFKDLQKVARM